MFIYPFVVVSSARVAAACSAEALGCELNKRARSASIGCLRNKASANASASAMTNLIYVCAYVPVSAPAHYANARVYARVRNNCVSIFRQHTRLLYILLSSLKNKIKKYFYTEEHYNQTDTKKITYK